MKSADSNIPLNTDSGNSAGQPENGSSKPLLLSIFKWIALSLAGIIGIIVILLCGLSIYLTPERLTNLVNRESSRYLNADIFAKHIDYTLWRSFPRFNITSDSIIVISRSLKGISPDIRRQLPDNADFLGSLHSFSGSINVVDIFLNRYVIHDVRVDGLNLNFVAWNDSINNYNILPSEDGGFKKVPYFSAELISLRNPGVMEYFSAATATKASLRLNRLILERLSGNGDNKDEYHLALGGKITASSAGLDILNNFPFSLAGNMNLRFNPFGISLSDYAIDLGAIHSQLNMSLGIGDDPKIESLSYHISKINLMNLLGYIPKEFLPSLEGINADMPISASARLTSPWTLSSETLPGIEVDFKIPAGVMTYTLSLPNSAAKRSESSDSKSITYPLQYSELEGKFFFDGPNPKNSYLDIPEFNVSSDGLKVGLKARVSNLTERPLVAAVISVTSDLKRSLKAIPMTPPFNVEGNLKFNSSLNFNLSALSANALKEGLSDIRADGQLTLTNLKLDFPDQNISTHIDKLTALVSESASALTPEAVFNPEASVRMAFPSVNAFTPSGIITLSGLKIYSQSKLNGMVTPQILQEGLPLTISVESDMALFADRDKGFLAEGSAIRISDIAGLTSAEALGKALKNGLKVKSSHISITSGKDHFDLINPDLNLSIVERISSRLVSTTPAGIADPDSLLPHTPELFTFTTPPTLKNFLDNYKFNLALKADRMNIITPGFKRDDYIANIDIEANEERIILHRLEAMIKQTSASISGEISNLRNFLLLPPSADNPLKVNVGINVGTIDINALARGYAESVGGIDNIPTHAEASANDSIALMVPRNIDASLHFHADRTIYTTLHLFDINADINLRNGVADIPRLYIGTGFGAALLNLKYNSSDIQKLRLDANLNMADVNIVEFFKNFHVLLEMMPEMKNLSGNLSLNAAIGGEIFPSMFINMPSANVELNLGGRNLKVHQSDFIRKITKMMLIRTDSDIHIMDMDVHASIRDNLIQLDPFNFEFDRYKLSMEGTNNFNGNLYYHLAVLKSPVPFPFSINIEGHFSHPELRFGGPRFDVKHSEEISSEIEQEMNINLTHIFRSFLGVFLKHAAMGRM